MRLIAYAGSFLGALTMYASLLALNPPSGLEPVFKGVEPGKKFHPLWPPIAGQSALGILVEAKNPKEPMAFFESIESPTYRNPNFNGLFEAGEISYAQQIDLTRERTIDVKTAFSQLDAIAASGKAPPAAEDKPAAAKGNGDKAPAEKPAPAAGGPKAAVEPKAEDAGRTSTGIDISNFSNATVKVNGLKVTFYTLGTLMGIRDKNIVSPKGFDLLVGKNNPMWFIHRTLSVDSLEYNLTAKSDINTGFFAQLVQWLPTFSLRYKNNRTIVINSSAPLTIGYKLWRPDLQGFGGANADDVALEDLGLADAEIDKILGAQR